MHAWPPSDPFMQLYWHRWYLIWCHPCYPTRRIHNTNTRRKMRKYIYLHMLYFILCKLYVYLEIHTYRQLFGKTDTSTGICCPVYTCRISHASYIHHTYITLHYITWILTLIPSSVLPVFFPGGSVRFLKNTIFQKSSRQWVRVPGHDMGPGIKYHTKKGPEFVSWKLPDVQWQEINFCLLWLRGGWSISLCM